MNRLWSPLLAGVATATSVFASSFHGLTLDFASVIAGSLAVLAAYAALPSLKGGRPINRLTHVSIGLTSLQIQPLVDLAAMANRSDRDDVGLVVNGIDNPIVP
jgi:hypothetical protein